jgi:non-heme chloroperoxidase
MNTFTTPDGVEIFYKDWGSGQPIVFSHGWPLSADDWDAQMLFFLNTGFRVIAHDRRGHGRSSQTGGGHDMDHYAADLAALTRHLDLKHAIHVGHSTGGGEVAAYIGRHGESRVAKAVLIGAVTPVMLKTDSNPGGTPLAVFDGFRTALAANTQFFLDVPTGPFYGFNRPGATVSQGTIRNWWRQGMMGAANAHYDCIKAFSETDLPGTSQRSRYPRSSCTAMTTRWSPLQIPPSSPPSWLRTRPLRCTRASPMACAQLRQKWSIGTFSALFRGK